MDKENPDINELIVRLQARLSLCEAELRAQNALIKALIATHLGPDVVLDAFGRYTERSVSAALASTNEDQSIAAFENFRDHWLEWIRPHAEAALRRQHR
ncbi:MAG TPA: hypothetical protein VL689_00425 [Paraburkholderia sp.]|jgi:hypothetical protein|nr:hypothetical protein [Paraburkholderia sp.]